MSTRSRDGGGELPYTGTLGATRYEPAFLAAHDGVSHRVDLVRGVNAMTDPALAAAAQDGTLHRLDNGTYLAVPYVYHDPSERKFALVVPVARAHEELTLRAELLVQLSRDATLAIPRYVRDARVVIGMEETCKAYLTETTIVPSQRRARAGARRRRHGTSRREGQKLAAQLEGSCRFESVTFESGASGIQTRSSHLDAREASDCVDEQNAVRANKSALQARERMLQARADSIEARARDVEEAASDDASEWARTREMSRPVARDLEPIEAEPIDSHDDDDQCRRAPNRLPDTRAAGRSCRCGRYRRGRGTLEAEELDHGEPAAAASAATKDVPAEWLARGHDAYARGRRWRGAHVGSRWRRPRQGLSARARQLDLDAPGRSRLGACRWRCSAWWDRITTSELRGWCLDATSPDDRAVVETLARDFRVRLEVVSSSWPRDRELRRGRSVRSQRAGCPGGACRSRQPGAADAAARRSRAVARSWSCGWTGG